jgi:hypothetical protein
MHNPYLKVAGAIVRDVREHLWRCRWPPAKGNSDAVRRDLTVIPPHFNQSHGSRFLGGPVGRYNRFVGGLSRSLTDR